MKKIWLDSYPPGVPAEIDPHAYASLTELLERSCARFHDLVAFDSMGVEMTYGTLDRLSRDFAAFLQGEAGLRRGERLAVMLPNVLQYPVALLGALRAGAVVVNVNPLFTAAELEYQLADSGATAIVVLENFAHTLERALAGSRIRCVITTQLADLFPPARRWLTNLVVKYVKRIVPSWSIPGAIGFRDALERGAGRELENLAPSPYDTAFLQYTGGTTGRAKGAILSHGNLVANVEQTAAWVGIRLEEGRETVITALPLYHVFALTANLLVFLRLGGRNVLVANPRDIPRLVAELKRVRFTAITGVNTLYNALLDSGELAGIRAANGGALKLAIAGGMALQRAVAERWRRAMGVPLIEGYGLTEASPIVCANPIDAGEFSGSIGLPLPSTEVAILDERGNELEQGEIGEICVRGPQVMRGYWNAPTETDEAFTGDGWLRSGDLGYMSARGFVQLLDRRKDVIVVSGFKAYPTEIEDVIVLHPGVRDAGVVGVPDAHSGEAVAAFVVRRDPALTAEAVLEHCRQRLTRYKLPRHVEFRDQLPRTPIGKVLRRQLRQEPPAPMAEYPARLAHEHRLFDGRTVTIRPIRRNDDAGERDFLNRLSGESRYLRFHKWVRAPSDKLVHFLTDVDYDRHMAYVCTAPAAEREQIVGEARYVLNPDGRSCEFGVVIADTWHKTGIAGLLMEALIETARDKGLATMEGLVLRRNAPTLRFARALGFEIFDAPEDPLTFRVVKRLKSTTVSAP